MKKGSASEVGFVVLGLALVVFLFVSQGNIEGNAIDDLDLEEVEDFDDFGEEGLDEFPEEEGFEEEAPMEEYPEEDLPAEEAYEEPTPAAPAGDTNIPPTLVRQQAVPTTEQSNVQILEQQVWWGKALHPKEQVEKVAWFQDIICERYEGEPTGVYGKGTRSQDKVSFKVINNDERQYKIGYTLPYSEHLMNKNRDMRLVPARLSLNGRRIRDIKACCGSDVIEPGQVLECNQCNVLLRFGEPDLYVDTHAKMVNNLEWDSDYVSSQVKFTCNE